MVNTGRCGITLAMSTVKRIARDGSTEWLVPGHPSS